MSQSEIIIICLNNIETSAIQQSCEYILIIIFIILFFSPTRE